MDGPPTPGTPHPEFPPPPPPPGPFPELPTYYQGGTGIPQGPPREMLAAVGSRFGARLIDGLILGVPTSILFFMFAWDRFAKEIERAQNDPASFHPWTLMGDVFWVLILALIVDGAYEITLTALRGQTLGKMAVGIKVVQIEDGQIPSWVRAGLRYALPRGVGLVPTVGGLGELLVYLWLLWDPLRQGLHDKVARTVVIRVR